MTPEQLDAHPMLFNTQNGTIELQTGLFREHRREDRLTYISPVTYDPHATCPTWEKFVSDIMCHRPELIAFLQHLTGYILTGDVRYQGWFLFYGLGANGKSTYIEVLRGLMGHDYAKSTHSTRSCRSGSLRAEDHRRRSQSYVARVWSRPSR
jgi:putative DNA primase/helicase